MSEEKLEELYAVVFEDTSIQSEAIRNYIKQLQTENENLKQINEEHRKLNGELREESNVLTEFEKWLEEDIKNEIEHPIPEIYHDCERCKTIILDKLQELKKEGKK